MKKEIRSANMLNQKSVFKLRSANNIRWIAGLHTAYTNVIINTLTITTNESNRIQDVFRCKFCIKESSKCAKNSPAFVKYRQLIKCTLGVSLFVHPVPRFKLHTHSPRCNALITFDIVTVTIKWFTILRRIQCVFYEHLQITRFLFLKVYKII